MTRRFSGDEAGNGAVEFALVVPVLAMLILGVINLVALLWAQSSLNYAADRAARTWAVTNSGTVITAPTVNESTTAAQTDALARYHGPALTSLAFVGTPPQSTGSTPTGNCQLQSGTASGVNGYVMTGSGTYYLNGIFVTANVPLKAEACFPFIH